MHHQEGQRLSVVGASALSGVPTVASPERIPCFAGLARERASWFMVSTEASPDPKVAATRTCGGGSVLEISEDAECTHAAPTMVPGMVSVIIPVYNRPSMLQEAVLSALQQTRGNLEVIIVDDGSTDDTARVSQRVASTDSRVRVIRIAHQGRPGTVRQVGTTVARGEFIQYLDSDDLIDPRKFELLVPLLERSPDAGLAYTPSNHQRPDGSITPFDPPHAEGRDRILPAALAGRLWPTSSPLYRRALLQAAGPWSNLRCWEDIEYDMRLATLHPLLVFHPDPVTTIRDHGAARLSGLHAYGDPDRLADMASAVVRIDGAIASAMLDPDGTELRTFASEVLLLGERCRAHDLHDWAAACRGVARRLGHPAADLSPLPIAAAVRPAQGSFAVAPGAVLRIDVVLANLGAVTMRGGNFAFEIVAQVRNSEGESIGAPAREVVVDPINPGETGAVSVPVRMPDAKVIYFVEFDILWGATALLGGPANPLAVVKLLVTSRPEAMRWALSCHAGAHADLDWPDDEAGTLRIAIRNGGTAPWHVQLNRTAIATVRGERYRLTAELRAESPRQVAVGVSLAHEPWSGLGHYAIVALDTCWKTMEWEFAASETAEAVRTHLDAGIDVAGVFVRHLVMEAIDAADVAVEQLHLQGGRLALDTGIEPLSRFWGRERGLPPHRLYLEQFLARHADDIRGRCLEFQDPTYIPRFGRDAVARLDILHVDDTNPLATLVADLSLPNDLPSNAFDCIVCTHVLQLIEDLPAAIRELHRILAPGGVLLVGEPHVSMASDLYGEIWRFTPHGLGLLLGRAFGVRHVEVTGYGNSLTTAGDLRGLVVDEFTRTELGTHDRPFALEVCARAVKST